MQNASLRLVVLESGELEDNCISEFSKSRESITGNYTKRIVRSATVVGVKICVSTLSSFKDKVSV